MSHLDMFHRLFASIFCFLGNNFYITGFEHGFRSLVGVRLLNIDQFSVGIDRLVSSFRDWLYAKERVIRIVSVISTRRNKCTDFVSTHLFTMTNVIQGKGYFSCFDNFFTLFIRLSIFFWFTCTGDRFNKRVDDRKQEGSS